MNTMPSEASIFSWAIGALAGAGSLIEGYVNHGPRINQAQLDDLRRVHKLLGQLVQSAEIRLIEHGAEYHAPIEPTRPTERITDDDPTRDEYGPSIGDSSSDRAASDPATDSGSEPGGRGY